MRRAPPLLLVLLSLLAACGTAEPSPAGDLAAGSADCRDVETFPLQGGSHLLGDQEPPVPYNSTPPTSGWHSSGPVDIGVHGGDDALSEPEQVSVLEAGGVVVTYRGLDDEERAALEEAARQDHAGRVAVTPYDGLGDGEVAFTAWGTAQRCSGLDLDALAAFVDTYADEEPAVPGEH
jgi:hypothetical protein